MKIRTASLICWLTLGLASTLAAEPKQLTLKEAQEIALRQHPRITVAELQALAAGQVVLQVRSAFLPQISSDISAVGTGDPSNTRVAAGSLGAAHAFDRASGGLTLSQLVTDFGRTSNLTESSRLHARAAKENAEAIRDLILVQVNASYFTALQAQAVVAVAEQTVATRQLVYDQVKLLTQNKLKSELDLSFAGVTLEEGKLLLAKARNDLKAASVAFSNILGFREQQEFVLMEEPMPGAIPADASPLVTQAMATRPELSQLRLERDSTKRFARAERALDYPTIKIGGATGATPERDNSQLKAQYAAGGLFMSIPLYEGGLYAARQSEAELKAHAAEENIRDMEDNIASSVRVAWLNANYASEKLQLTTKLLQHADLAYTLAQARYKVGASSMVELSQAQLNKTSAEIGVAAAKYDYLTQRALLSYQVGTLR
jgi:outer membrane protein